MLPRNSIAPFPKGTNNMEYPKTEMPEKIWAIKDYKDYWKSGDYKGGKPCAQYIRADQAEALARALEIYAEMSPNEFENDGGESARKALEEYRK